MSADLRIDIDRVLCGWDQSAAPGIAVGVVRDGEPIYTRCFGLANVEHNVPITPSTVFDIGSVTKQCTAFAILLLVRDGKLSLNDDVRDYVPDLPSYNPAVRIRHCLFHTSGLSDWIEALELAGPTSDYAPLKRAFRTITALRDTVFPAGQAHSYSNTGYVLLAWIVERVTGKPFAEFLRERVFSPLGMARSTFRSDPFEFFHGQAQGYFQEDDTCFFRVSRASDVSGDGGMLTSIDDMTRWFRNFTSMDVGDTALFGRFFAPGHLDDEQKLRYGAGWVLSKYRGRRTAQHGGMAEGFQSYVLWVPEIRTGIAVLGNVRPYLPWRLATGVLDAVLGYSEAAPSIALPDATSNAGSCSRQDDITGRYFTATGLPVSVQWRGRQLFIDIWLWGRMFGPDANSTDTFTEEHSGDRVTFQRNAHGSVTHFNMVTNDGACIDNHSLINKAVKYEHTTLRQSALTELEGIYLSQEIDSIYAIIAGDGGLIVRHLRCSDWHLKPIKLVTSAPFSYEFAQDVAWPGLVTFERAPNGKVTGFRVRGARANLLFRKQPPQTSEAN